MNIAYVPLLKAYILSQEVRYSNFQPHVVLLNSKIQNKPKVAGTKNKTRYPSMKFIK